ncbi:GNAT family N-acetyltransferase [Leifsonia sp. 2MCAF36]|uniref:GNAT family N-acetyltransferase n=1 Tax=Leifsonia sp. 2MCAF36 TaxID=3232988 RepID=UPI003F94963E
MFEKPLGHQGRADLDGSIALTRASQEDAGDIARVWRSAWLDGHRDRVPAELLEARDEFYFRSRAQDLADFTTLAREAGVILGLVIVVGNELQQLMVDHAARGRGVGSLLLSEAERGAAASGLREIWLAVVPGNSAARALYEARGWIDCGPEAYLSRTLTGGVVPVPVHRYSKRLRGLGASVPA